MHCKVILVVAIVVVDFRLNLGLTESVGHIQGLDAGGVVLEQSFAVMARGKELAGDLNLEALAEHLPGEIFVSRDLDQFEFMHGTRIDTVDDPKAVRTAFLLKIDGGIEVAAALEIVEEVALAFVEQVFVESVFLIDGNLSFQDAAADVKSLGVDHHDRTRVEEEGVVDRVGFWVILLFGDRDLGEHALLLLKLLTQTLKTSGDAGSRDAVAGSHPGNILNLGLRQGGMPGDFYLSNVRRGVCRNVEKDTNLLGGCIGGAFSGDASPVIAVLLHELSNVLQGAVELVESM